MMLPILKHVKVPVVSNVTMARGSIDGDQSFSEWAKKVSAEQKIDRVNVDKLDYESVRIVGKRQWFWPKIWDCYDVRENEMTLSDDNAYVECGFEFARMERCPWYKVAWWWLGGWFRGLAAGRAKPNCELEFVGKRDDDQS